MIEENDMERSGVSSQAGVTATGREVLTDTRARLATLKEDTDDYVRKNPAKAVFAALGIGFILGLMRRR